MRSQFIKANAVENDHPVPLVQFYLTAVQQMVADQRYQDAFRTLGPLAYSPHPGEHTARARQLMKDVEGKLGESAPAE